ncbi:hypothetical protein [Parerythrobacter aestuarii]|uniref:hypothetical protein n=1 Tax=Parerythrobacter aestuarii TaxID=3020909 RepID=UPI0024DEAE49|nr:hypothetical protein [Parerythrobacter aestuarii]
MTDHPDPRSFVGAAPAATTSPATTRHDGWTPARQAAFLHELSATHNVAAAARVVGMSRQSAYQLRTRMQGKPFAKAWEAAFLTRFDVLAETALDRALNGVEVPHFYNGELVGTSRKYDERLTLALLATRRSFVPQRPYDSEPAAAFKADELGALIERVADGPEEWRESCDDEYDARYGWETEEGAGPPSAMPSCEDAE